MTRERNGDGSDDFLRGIGLSDSEIAQRIREGTYRRRQVIETLLALTLSLASGHACVVRPSNSPVKRADHGILCFQRRRLPSEM